VIQKTKARKGKKSIQIFPTTTFALYQVPTSMAIAEFSDHGPWQRIFLIFDDSGILQIR
jgi:hypothetical protein